MGRRFSLKIVDDTLKKVFFKVNSNARQPLLHTLSVGSDTTLSLSFLSVLGKTSVQKKRFLSGIARIT